MDYIIHKIKIRYSGFIPRMLLFTLLSIISVQAQDQNKYKLDLKSTLIFPEENSRNFIMDKSPIQKYSFNNSIYLVFQFYSLPDDEQKQRLISRGVELLDYLNGYCYIVKINSVFDWQELPDLNIRSVVFWNKKMKAAPEILIGQLPEWSLKSMGYADVIVNPFEWMDESIFSSGVKSIGGEVLEANQTFRRLNVRIPRQDLEKLIELPWVQWVEPAEPPRVDDNLPGKNLHRSNVLNYGSRNLTGNNVRIGIWDGGTVGPHIDFSGRLVLAESYLATDHGTHVAGTMAGAGLLDPYARGMAPGALIYSYDYNGDVNAEVAAAISTYNITMTQNSWGYGDGFVNCTNKDPYNSNSREQDINVVNNPQLIHCHSAGNSQAVCTGGWGTTTGKAAKNNIVVANVSNIEAISSSSSFGPVQDGRLKPEISGLGTSVYSTLPDDSYTGGYSGTSMATPGVSGTIAQLVERYKQLNSNVNPPASLMKAIACNTAKDLGNAGPDYKFGFGRINGLQAVRAIEQNRYVVDNVNTGGTKTISISVPANTKRIRVMLCWTDPAAASNSNPALVNDLDLTVTDPSLSVYNPWILTPASPSSVAVRGVDHLNNIEQVTIDNPAAGNYTLSVNGFAVPVGSNQVYSLTWEIEKTAIEVIYPNGGEVFVPGTQERIYWDNLGITSNQTISYSTNNGSTWTNISTSVTSTTTYFLWTVPSIASSQVLIRVINGSVGDTSDAVFSILGTPGSLAVTSGCNSSQLNISWAAVTNATHYDVLQLNPAGTGSWNVIAPNLTSTSYTVSGLSPSITYWFTVRAKNNTSSITGGQAIAKSGMTMSSSIPAAFVSAGGPLAICPDSSVTLTASGGLMDTYTQSIIPYQSYSVSTDIPVSLTDDDVSAALPIGFNFNFFGQTYSQFYIGSNGIVAFNNTNVNTTFTSSFPQTIPNSATPNNLIALFWTDLNPATGGTITYLTSGVAPNRKLVIYYNNVRRYGSTNTVDGRIELFENSNLIDMHVANVSSGTNTMGLESPNGTAASPVAGRNRASYSISVPEAIRFTPAYSNLSWQPGSQSTQSISVNTPGNYSFSYTTDGCLNYSDTITVSSQSAGLCPGPVTVQIKMYPEGFYTGSGKLRGILSAALCDTVQIALASQVNPYAILYSGFGILDTAGNVAYTFPVNAWGNSYYLVVKHRNSIETWSSSPVSLNNTSVNFDFTSSASSAYGSNLKNLGAGKFGIYSGDINQDGMINQADQLLYENAVTNFTTGYVPEDLSGDLVVESADYSLLENNYTLGVVLIKP